ncbi:hypothetical protein BJ970_004218 [Saccharopolyspora phatthalungensis]|uniref:Uncharacterized protein n=1 Tax=Saccharopolyspora phatthalungensis TaxID=664693 RepID=A0A840Q7K8_9PSEU|nr:hypothetical protein [Saccharopolyspora phatthalungensis]
MRFPLRSLIQRCLAAAGWNSEPKFGGEPAGVTPWQSRKKACYSGQQQKRKRKCSPELRVPGMGVWVMVWVCSLRTQQRTVLVSVLLCP